MVCIYCNSKTKTAVVNSRVSAKSACVWRRRSCPHCASIITTREQVDYQNALRVQKTSSGPNAPGGRLGAGTRFSPNIDSTSSLEPFQRDRLFLSIHNSLSHRKTALNDSTQLTDTIIAQLLPLQTNGVLTTSSISNVTASILNRFDSVAGIHYHAHHQS